VTLFRPNVWYPVSVRHTALLAGNLLPLSVYATLGSGGPALLVDDCSLTSLGTS
jgi:hypothetical protein